MANYYVLKRQVCPACKGKKWVMHPIWKKFSDWANSLERSLPAVEIDAWWEDNWSFKELPDEETLCDECEGTGLLEQDIDLRQALSELGLMLPAQGEA